MARFKIDWTEEVWNRVFVEADSYAEARELFWNNDFDLETVEITGGEIQDSVYVMEVE